nr:hypothetical protein [Tanacetum cinerariifolium]
LCGTGSWQLQLSNKLRWMSLLFPVRKETVKSEAGKDGDDDDDEDDDDDDKEEETAKDD